jgi:hypothetical protein
MILRTQTTVVRSSVSGMLVSRGRHKQLSSRKRPWKRVRNPDMLHQPLQGTHLKPRKLCLPSELFIKTNAATLISVPRATGCVTMCYVADSSVSEIDYGNNLPSPFTQNCERNLKVIPDHRDHFPKDLPT